MSSNQEKKDDLREHDIVRKIKRRGEISNVKSIKGYLGDSPDKDYIRLFFTLDFDQSIDIPKNKIIHTEVVPKDEMEFGGTCIWVSKDTELIYTKLDRSKIEAQFIEGKIMEDYFPLAEHVSPNNHSEYALWTIIVRETIKLSIRLKCDKWTQGPCTIGCP
jgi:hypothetical protein